MLKLFGCALVLMSCYMMSSALAGREKMKIERVELLILLVRTIRDKVDCYALPIGKILDECREEILFPLGIKKPISELSRLVCECKDGMTKEAEKTFCEFAGAFGKSYREQQVRLCDSTIDALNSQREKLLSAYPVKKKTAATFCFAAGGILVIVLL